ncbi:MAG TPA: hypothetical protein VIM53_02290 [Candidatus Saccharimonadales bacterium]
MSTSRLGIEMAEAAQPAVAPEFDSYAVAEGELPMPPAEAVPGGAETALATEAPTPGVVAGIMKFVGDRWKTAAERSRMNTLRYHNTQAELRAQQGSLLARQLGRPF